MLIKRLEVSNFRSFRRLEADLGQFNVLIGPNAAGKSNFIQVLKFIKDIIASGLENAISLQGGPEYIRNIKLMPDKNEFSLRFVIEPVRKYHVGRETRKGLIGLRLTEFAYEFALALDGDSLDYTINRDILHSQFDFYNLIKTGDEVTGETKITSGELLISNLEGSFSVELNTKRKLGVEKEALFPIITDMQKFLEERSFQSLILESPLFYMFPFEKIATFLSGLAIYDFDSRLPRKATQFIGRAELEENGENIAIVLRKILANDEKRRMLFNLVRNTLPFVEEIEVKKIFDKYLQLMVKESYNREANIPSSLMSDGTIFIIALIVALYFEKKSVAIFEEPERRIHPYLISKVIDMMKDASIHKQIIMSTHNPEAVKHSDLEDLLLVNRDNEGFSTIYPPHKKKEIEVFLKNQIGIEDLYIQNLLGI